MPTRLAWLLAVLPGCTDGGPEAETDAPDRGEPALEAPVLQPPIACQPLADTDNTSCGVVDPLPGGPTMLDPFRAVRVPVSVSEPQRSAVPGPRGSLVIVEHHRLLWVQADGATLVIGEGAWSPAGLSWAGPGWLRVTEAHGTVWEVRGFPDP